MCKRIIGEFFVKDKGRRGRGGRVREFLGCNVYLKFVKGKYVGRRSG